jgi:hypothetical protein
LRPYLEKTKTNTKRAGTVAHMVEYLPGKCEALNSNASTNKNIFFYFHHDWFCRLLEGLGISPAKNPLGSHNDIQKKLPVCF